MTTKDVILNRQDREKMLRGVAILADSVKVTVGLKGRVDDVLHAKRAAVEEAILPGSGSRAPEIIQSARRIAQ